jgi:hypothetical protein
MGISREALRKKLIMSDDVLDQLNHPQKAGVPAATEVEVPAIGEKKVA